MVKASSPEAGTKRLYYGICKETKYRNSKAILPVFIRLPSRPMAKASSPEVMTIRLYYGKRLKAYMNGYKQHLSGNWHQKNWKNLILNSAFMIFMMTVNSSLLIYLSHNHILKGLVGNDMRILVLALKYAAIGLNPCDLNVIKLPSLTLERPFGYTKK